MFLLSHRPRARAGDLAVRLLAGGVVLLVPGLLIGVEWLAVAGGAVALGGLGAHLVSLLGVIRHRRRRLELLHAFVIAGSAALVTGVACGAIAGLAPLTTITRTRVAAAEVAALFGWILLAVVGHAHKVVPFIAWSAIRARGITTAPGGEPLLFAHLYDRRVARATFAVASAAVVLVIVGILAASPGAIAAAGIAFSTAGALASANLAFGPLRVVRSARAHASPLAIAGGRP
jgi:uncharacterized membrane protein YjgN (DUF898 family)